MSTLFPNRVQPNRGTFILKQADELKKYCEMRIISPLPYLPAWMKSSKYSIYAKIPREDWIYGHDVYYPRFLAIPRISRIFNGLSLFIGEFRRFRKIVKSFNPDLVLCFWAYPDGFANVLLAKAFGLRVIVGCRGSDVNQMTRKFFLRKLIKWTLSHSDRTLSVSHALKAEMVNIGVPADNVVVIHNGVEVERFAGVDAAAARRKLGLDEKSKIALCVSRLSWEKGIDNLIRAFAAVKSKAAHLVIVGGGLEDAHLKELASSLGLGNKVTFAGEQPHEEIPTWLNASDMLVLPSRMEGCPNVVLEAFACGKPVVASRVGGIPELIRSEEHGLMVEPNDPDALAAAIDRAIEKDWQSDVLFGAVSDRSWDTVVQEILEEISKLPGFVDRHKFAF